MPKDIQYDEGGSQLGNVGAMSMDELRSRALELSLRNGIPRKRSDLVLQILARHAEEADQLLGMGVLEVSNDGHGFLRQPTGSGSESDTEVYVSPAQVRRFGLRPGDQVAGEVRAPREGERYYALIRVEVVNGQDPESTRNRTKFESLTPIFPDELIKLETTPKKQMLQNQSSLRI